jgi:peptidoglycan/LPS O-acetylase OafA/YrhL
MGPLDLSGLSGPLLAIYQLAFAVTNLAVVVGAVSLVVRFRRARGAERQRLRWVALAAALASLGSLVVAASALGASPPLLGWVGGVYVAVLPVAIGASVLRYRLYDLDRIVSRALAYALLTVVLGGVYAAVVLGLGQLLGRSSSLAVAAATLAVAALFQPFRRRVQAAVDRRFNRRRHDAAQTIAAFSTRLRDQLDLATLTGELLAVVDQTMQPTQASMWLRPTPEPLRPGRGRPR